MDSQGFTTDFFYVPFHFAFVAVMRCARLFCNTMFGGGKRGDRSRSSVHIFSFVIHLFLSVRNL